MREFWKKLNNFLFICCVFIMIFLHIYWFYTWVIYIYWLILSECYLDVILSCLFMSIFVYLVLYVWFDLFIAFVFALNRIFKFKRFNVIIEFLFAYNRFFDFKRFEDAFTKFVSALKRIFKIK